TFINNFFTQPFLIFFSLETGYFMMEHKFLNISMTAITGIDLKAWVLYLAIGGVTLGFVLGTVAALITFVIITFRTTLNHQADMEFINLKRFIKELYKQMPAFERNFVCWKIRLDRFFSTIVSEDFGQGPVVDLGCGYGLGLAVAASKNSDRRFIGCDIDSHRIEIAKKVFFKYNSEFSIANMVDFKFDSAGLILLLDVLQYLNQADQTLVLQRCCESLQPGGKLIIRINDNSKGIYSWFVKKFDWIIFRINRIRRSPNQLKPQFYREILSNNGLTVREIPFINKLPLSHIILLANRII
ncbi:MAG: hypothetical protein A2161_14020, partial [Candidatus Schekmanbacteria bacterium RBG_13_48_7]